VDSNREEFLKTVRAALGRVGGDAPAAMPEATALYGDADSVSRRAAAVRETMSRQSEQLLAEMAVAAAKSAWSVHTARSVAEARDYIASVAAKLGAKLAMRSAYEVLDELALGPALTQTGTELTLMARSGEDADGTERRGLREKALKSDIGITGVDYAISETGSVAIAAGRGVSRLVSLVMPVHIAVVRRGQVLPSLDDLFTLRRLDFLQGRDSSYMNIISGPSRSADIEQTIVRGVHGPREVHMVLLDRGGP